MLVAMLLTYAFWLLTLSVSLAEAIPAAAAAAAAAVAAAKRQVSTIAEYAKSEINTQIRS